MDPAGQLRHRDQQAKRRTTTSDFLGTPHRLGALVVASAPRCPISRSCSVSLLGGLSAAPRSSPTRRSAALFPFVSLIFVCRVSHCASHPYRSSSTQSDWGECCEHCCQPSCLSCLGFVRQNVVRFVFLLFCISSAVCALRTRRPQ